MKALLVLGIVLSIAAAICGLYFVLFGLPMAILGVGPDGPVESFQGRCWGLGVFVLGIIYLTPVLWLRQRPLIVTYAIVAVVVALFSLVAYSAIPDMQGGSPLDCLGFGAILLFFPLVLSAISYARAGRTAPSAQRAARLTGR